MKKRDENNFYKKYNLKWVIFISIWTFVFATIFSVITEGLISKIDILLAFLVLILVITLGIIFDIIGIAVTSSEEKPFHSMAANRIKEARYAIKLVRNASQVSNFCNDVIGDISGIISGAVGTTIVYKIIENYSFLNASILTTVLTSLIASFTVGGKAIGKSIALLHSENIIFKIAVILNFSEEKLGIELLKDRRKNKR